MRVHTTTMRAVSVGGTVPDGRTAMLYRARRHQEAVDEWNAAIKLRDSGAMNLGYLFLARRDLNKVGRAANTHTPLPWHERRSCRSSAATPNSC